MNTLTAWAQQMLNQSRDPVPLRQAVVLSALAEAQLNPASHACVETHGSSARFSRWVAVVGDRDVGGNETRNRSKPLKATGQIL